jgi:hypothetical protein
MRKAVRRAALATGVLAIALGAMAGPASARNGLEAKWRAACWRDAVTTCTLHALSNDRAGTRDCLVRNINRISKACRNVINEANSMGIHDVQPQDEPVASAAASAAEPANR